MPVSQLAQLIQTLRYLPGVGPRSAERLAYYLLQHRERSLHLAQTLASALNTIQTCETCHHYTESIRCEHCRNPQRDKSLLCIVESPHDLLAIEQSQAYQGQYYVLHGKISPLDGIGPQELKLHQLVDRVQQANLSEIIFALSPTVEGQTTLHCIQSLLSPFPLRLSQLAQGIPQGSDLSALDSYTISNALTHRSAI